MTQTNMHSILIVGGTGAQGSAIVRYLSSLGTYSISCITRDTTSSHAQSLAALPHVDLVADGEAGHDEDALTSALEGKEYVWVNTNGFALGEMAETYWGIRMFELSVRAGVKHFIYSGIEGAYKQSGYDPRMRIGHFEGKARVSEWMLSQPTSPMVWTILDSGAYLESLSEMFAPQLDAATGVATFILPYGDGAMPMIYLADKAKYVHWAYENPAESNGMRLALATCHVSGEGLASAFTTVTGRPAKYQPVPVEAWMQKAFGNLPKGMDTMIGFLGMPEAILVQSYKQDFTNWFNVYRANLLKRDYELMDKILPDRLKSLEEFMRIEGYDGEKKSLLKDLAHPERKG